MAENQLLKDALIRGLVDERKIAFVADITCSNGNRGRALLFLNGTILSFCEMRGLTQIGELLEAIELKQAEFIKGSSFVLNSYLKFSYQGNTYRMSGFAQAKTVLEEIRKSCGKGN